MQQIHEFEGTDRRQNKYSNFDHPFLLRPEALMIMIGATITTAVGVTMWVTAELNVVDDRSLKNEQEISSMQRYQSEQNSNLKHSLDDLKKTTRSQYEQLDRKLDKLIDRELTK